MSTENTFAELSRMYDELKGDFDRYRERTAEDLNICERTSYCSIACDILAPLYDDMYRAWQNTCSHDVEYFMREIKRKLTERKFIIMDDTFFKTFFNNHGDRAKITDIAEIMKAAETGNPDDHNKVDGVFSCGLFDDVLKKIVKYPKVSIKVFKDERQ